jgi:hypothetical protein
MQGCVQRVRQIGGMLALALVSFAGCGKSDGPVRVVVVGAVTLNGQSVEDGQIRYIPIDGTVGPITIAKIVGGQYTCDDKGGVPVGNHRVEILAWDPKAPIGGRGEPPRPQLAPEKYNEKSELKATIEETGSRVAKNFDL